MKWNRKMAEEVIVSSFLKTIFTLLGLLALIGIIGYTATRDIGWPVSGICLALMFIIFTGLTLAWNWEEEVKKIMYCECPSCKEIIQRGIGI
jgi:hypothetical protein